MNVQSVGQDSRQQSGTVGSAQSDDQNSNASVSLGCVGRIFGEDRFRLFGRYKWTSTSPSREGSAARNGGGVAQEGGIGGAPWTAQWGHRCRSSASILRIGHFVE